MRLWIFPDLSSGVGGQSHQAQAQAKLLRALASGVPKAQQSKFRVVWINLAEELAVVVAAQVSPYGGQDPAFSLPHLQGCWPQVCGCCRKESASISERGAIDTGRVLWLLITDARPGSWERLWGGYMH